LLEMKSKVKRFSKKGKPPLCTHDLVTDNDEILSACSRAGLTNDKKDPVKVVFYPIYLSGADHLLNLDYYEVMEGSHLGVFPSYYEPWGYTPLEGGALGVSSITTDLAGFGRYFSKMGVQDKIPGIYLIERMDKEYNEVVSKLSDIMYSYSVLTKQARTRFHRFKR